MTNERCSICGANLALVGRVHRCVPKVSPDTSRGDDRKVVPQHLGVPAVRSAPAHSRPAVEEIMPASQVKPVPRGTYQHRDPEKWRAYMRDYMRVRRAKLKLEKA